jgi:hypothetical protein
MPGYSSPMDEQHQATTEDATTDPPLDSAADGGAARTAGGDPAQSAAEKDPNDWVTGEEPMTAPQASYLQTLCQEAGEDFDDSMSKAEASRRIEELQGKTGRGSD